MADCSKDEISVLILQSEGYIFCYISFDSCQHKSTDFALTGLEQNIVKNSEDFNFMIADCVPSLTYMISPFYRISNFPFQIASYSFFGLFFSFTRIIYFLLFSRILICLCFYVFLSRKLVTRISVSLGGLKI